MPHGRITLRIVTAEMHHTLRSHRLVTAGDSGDFPHSASGASSNATLSHRFGTSFPLSVAIHLHGTKGMHSPNFISVGKLEVAEAASLLFRPNVVGKRRMKTVSHIVVVHVFPGALHKQARPFDEFVHGHDFGFSIMALIAEKGSFHLCYIL